MQLPERWRIVSDHPDYKVSDRGRFLRWRPGKRNTRFVGKILRTKLATNGYVCVSLDNKWERAHRHVAAAFIGPCPDGFQVNHKDGSKTNNRAGNLEYVTPSQNISHMLSVLRKRPGTQRGGNKRPLFNHDQIRTIRQRLANGESQRALALEYTVSAEAIRYIYIRRSYRYVAD